MCLGIQAPDALNIFILKNFNQLAVFIRLLKSFQCFFKRRMPVMIRIPDKADERNPPQNRPQDHAFVEFGEADFHLQMAFFEVGPEVYFCVRAASD